MPAKTQKKVLLTTAESRTGDAILGEFERKIDELSEIVLKYTLPKDVDLALRTFKHAKPIKIDLAEASEDKLVSCMKDMDFVVIIPPASAEKTHLGSSMINAAVKAGVKNCILLSDICVSCSSEKDSFHKFQDLEKHAQESFKGKINYCIVRSGHYMQNLFLYAKQMKEKNFLGLPIGKGKFSPVDVRDVAIAVINMIAGGTEEFKKKYANKTFNLSGQQSLSGEEIIEAAKKAGLPSELKFEDIPKEEAQNLLNKIPGMDKSEISLIIEDFDTVREGKLDVVHTDLKQLLGKENPTTINDFFREYKETFVNPA